MDNIQSQTQIPESAEHRDTTKAHVFWGYCRVSTADQNLDCTPQKDTIKREYDAKWAKTHIFGGFFVDPAVSGTVNFGERPAGSVALEAFRPGDALCGAKLDRLSRSLMDIVHLIKTCDALAVSLVACDLGINTATSVGKLVAHIIAAVAEWERERICERTQDAINAKLQRGYQNGGYSPKMGYVMARDGKLSPNLMEQLLMRKVTDLYEMGYTQYQIASALAVAGITSPRKGEEHKPINRRRVMLYLQRWKDILGTPDDVTTPYYDTDGQPLADPYQKVEEVLCSQVINASTIRPEKRSVLYRRDLHRNGLSSST